MTLIFSVELPDSLDLKPILISGSDSSNLPNKEYLILHQNGHITNLFEIRYDCHCSPFKEAMITNNILAVGFEEYFYLFDVNNRTSMLKLQMNGYFGHLYFNNELFYSTDSGGMFCIKKTGALIWQNNNLGIDGVVINRFADNKIFGSGEWDPPGGWRDFILDDQTGLLIK